MMHKYSIKILLLMFLLPACMFTNSLQKKLYVQSHVSKEYNLPEYPKKYKIICGKQSIITNNNEKYYQLQFDSVLKGKNRFLNIEFLMNNKDNIFPAVYETSEKIANGSLCYLYLISSASFYSEEKDMVSKMFDYSYKLPSDFDTIKEYLPKSTIANTGDTVIIANLNFSNYFNANNIAFILWQKDTTNTWQVSYELFFPETSKNLIKSKIKWKGRKRALYYAKHSFYILTFCVDVITFPFQLLLLKGQMK